MFWSFFRVGVGVGGFYAGVLLVGDSKTTVQKIRELAAAVAVFHVFDSGRFYGVAAVKVSVEVSKRS